MEQQEIKRYRKEIERWETRWANDDWTDEQDYKFRKYGFDDLLYNELYEKHQRNLRRIRKRTTPSQVTLWDFISTPK